RRTPNPDAGGSSPSWPAILSVKRADDMEKIKQIVNRALQFLTQARAELKKVTWPTRKQTLASTAVVMVVVLIVAVYLGVVDFILAKAVKAILG
ncbi:MAG TPA: preprotein translocase subunit SecE, partial [Smithellaceae bacterium]|nr:preprotein translocase subunit SecE [Smithellaceae bacterium]HPV48844.1 preprotein translocase subunit SecE [Smithellaceae bacterium]